tara:strand:+ start:93 stop:578 length:486 start_codon:yes stop_codon:yes gene_type:complete
MARDKSRKAKNTANKKIVEEVAATPESEGRGRAVLEYLKQKLMAADAAATGILRDVDASVLIGANDGVQRAITKGAAGMIDNVYLPMTNLVREKPITGGDRLSRAYDIALNPKMQAALRAVPAAALGAGVLGTGALVDAVTESEEERLLRRYLEMISNGGY